MYCGNCGKPVEDNTKFCRNCGQPVDRGTFCSNCGAQNSSLAEVCIKCGTRMSRSQTVSQSQYDPPAPPYSQPQPQYVPPHAPPYTPPVAQQAMPQVSSQPIVPHVVSATGKSQKSKISVAILALLLGQLGMHRFYAGKKRIGAVQLLLSIVGYPTYFFYKNVWIGAVILGIMGGWVFLDFVFILAGKFKDGKGLLIM